MTRRIRTIAGAIGVSAALAASGAHAFSDPTTFLPGPDTTIQFKYNNVETVVDSVGDVLTGLFAISSINDASGSTVYWAAGLSGSQLNGYFTDLTVAEIVPTAGGFDIYFTGGTLNIYNVANGSYHPTSPTDPLDPQVCGAGGCPSPWLTANFTPGVATDDPTTPFDESTATLVSTVTSLTAPLTGTGDGQLTVTGGTAAGSFGTLFSIQSNLQSCPTTNPAFAPNCQTAGTWPLVSFDPVVGVTASVPEPSVLVLVATSLLAFGGLARTKKR